jgi:hypothetical protein
MRLTGVTVDRETGQQCNTIVEFQPAQRSSLTD